MAIAITTGEPSGIGPDICIELMQQSHPDTLIYFGDADLIQHRAELLGKPIKLHTLQQYNGDGLNKLPLLAPGEAYINHIDLKQSCRPGKLSTDNAHYVLNTLDAAISACVSGGCAAMVTAPVHKGVINDAGISFSGHTEYLAEKTNCDRVVMMLATQGLRVALATTHLPLSQVSASITKELLQEVISILHTALINQFSCAAPKILVCGLNPHAGESGHLGREEIDTIEPVLCSLRDQGMNLLGPLPADTLFTPKYLDDSDAVLAMYHDQGLPTLKYKGFGNAVNITLGLPIIRTSVDHGTALDLAGTGQADSGSLRIALQYAREMCTSRSDHE